MDIKKKILNKAGKIVKETFMDTDNKPPRKNGKSSESRHADTIIRNHVVWSMGIGFLIRIPFADIFAASAVQLDMIRQLCRVYDREFSHTQGKAIISALTTSTITSAGVKGMIRYVPIIGNVTSAVFYGATTYALGEVFKAHFELGGTVLDFDTDRLSRLYKEKFEKGKKVAEDLRRNEENIEDTPFESPTEKPIKKVKLETQEKVVGTTSDDPLIRQLQELGSLKEDGIITTEEFEAMKKRILENMG